MPKLSSTIYIYIHTYDPTFLILAWNSTLHIQLITWHFYIEVLQITQNFMFIIPFSLPSCSSSSPPHFNTLYLYPSNCSSQNLVPSLISLVVQVALVVKNLPDNAEDVRDAGLISCSGKSPGRGYGNPLQFWPGESHGQRNLAGLYSSWNSPGQNTGLKPGLLHCRRILYQLSHQGSLGYSP